MKTSKQLFEEYEALRASYIRNIVAHKEKDESLDDFWKGVQKEAHDEGFEIAKNMYATFDDEDAYDKGWNDALDYVNKLFPGINVLDDVLHRRVES